MLIAGFASAKLVSSAMPLPHRATLLLNRVSTGDLGVSEELMGLIYHELHALARAHMNHERADHTLQATALVNEAYLKLIQPSDSSWSNRRQFYAMASRVMRSMLVDHARQKKSEKRGGGCLRVTLAGNLEAATHKSTPEFAILELHDALERLGKINPELVDMVELRYFGGLSIREISEALEQPPRTVDRRLQVAHAWLREHLDG